MDSYTTREIETNRKALLSIVAIILSLGAKTGLVSPLWGIEPSGCDRSILPRILHRAALAMLRPAEWAARRLAIALAKDLKPPLAKRRPPKPHAGSSFVRSPNCTGIYIPPATRMAMRAAGYPDPKHPVSGNPDSHPDSCPDAPLRPIALPLFDPPARGKRRMAPKTVPRVTPLGDFDRPSPIRPRLPLKPDDALDATRLGLRIVGLSIALEDLPRQALRYARRREAMRSGPRVRTLRNGSKRVLRRSPLHSWWLPGSRSAPEVHHILLLANRLARPAVGHDTS
jgi:hypothetical protein